MISIPLSALSFRLSPASLVCISGGILSGVFALWLLRKVARLFDKLR